jgi:glycosyltransferase involved in cell wall biosynthesis
MNKITLSYVITTYNKLPYLKEVIKLLLENIKEDEEIVVTDGASTDGTVEFLTELYRQGKIHQFVSEPDKGEAHGYNKCLLMAKGELIKIITDDDVFYYPAIQECKNFMLQHPEIDVLASLGASGSTSPPDYKVFNSYLQRYEDWKETNKPFAFCCLGLLIRRGSLAMTGLFSTGFIRVDAEFSYRITSNKVNLAWYTGFVWLHNGNPQSNSVKYAEEMVLEMRKLEQLYLNEPFLKNDDYQSYWYDILNILKKIPLLSKIKRFFFPVPIINQDSIKNTEKMLELSEKFNFWYNWLVKTNKNHQSTFLYKR